jgi:hypothetical protein
MSNTNAGGPAFPTTVRTHYSEDTGSTWSEHIDPGMTLRQYAAIKLKVPNSGTDWLDEMIEEANRLDREMLTGQGQ